MDPTDIVAIIQLTLNGGILVIGGFVYKMYHNGVSQTLEAMKQQVATKDAQIENARSELERFEKKSPEALEKSLATRLKNANEEIERLNSDRKEDDRRREELENEKEGLNRTLEQARGFRKMLELEGQDGVSEFIDEAPGGQPGTEVEVLRLGEVAVDSGQLMISDPCYIDSQWVREEFKDVRRYYDPEKREELVYREDFESFSDTLPGHTSSVNEMIENGELIRIEDPEDKRPRFSYAGACAVTQNAGYGSLPFKLGHDGAGVAFYTGWGDGMYPVYGEIVNGRIVRVYVNVS